MIFYAFLSGIINIGLLLTFYFSKTAWLIAAWCARSSNT